MDYHLAVMSHRVARPESGGLQRFLRVISRLWDNIILYCSFVLKDMTGTSSKPYLRISRIETVLELKPLILQAMKKIYQQSDVV
jgi:hypothetical protein